MADYSDSIGRRRAYFDCFDTGGDMTKEVEKTQKQQLKKMQSYLRNGDVDIADAETTGSFFTNLILSQNFEAFGGFVVLVNLVVITLETHARARANEAMLDYIADANRVLLAYYISECSARLYVLRRSFFCGVWNILDLVIVTTGILSEIMEAIAVSSSGVGQIGMLKSLRMMRLVRLVRLLVAFRELYVLLAGLGRCMKTLLWASGLIFLVLNVWAIVSVEYLHPIVKNLAAEGAFGTCSWCEDAFADVWKANLTWFQVTSGDGWSALGRPLAERVPWTYVFFVANISVMVWGLLNLVVAAIVDSSIQAREDDVQGAARNAVRARAHAFESFRNLCREMDQDGDGEVTTEEFKEFKETNLQLQQHLEVMGISDGDFDKCLKLMDVDGNGKLDFDEFAEEFTKMRSLVVKTNLYYVLRHVEFLHQSMVELNAAHRQIISDISEVNLNLTRLRTDKQEVKKGTISVDKKISVDADLCVPNTYPPQGLNGSHSAVDLESTIQHEDSYIVRVPMSSVLSNRSLKPGITMPEPSSADQILFVSSQAKREQLLTHWSKLHFSRAVSPNHYQELCKKAASTNVEVVECTKPEEIWGVTSTLMATPPILMPARTPVLIPAPPSPPPIMRAA